MDEIKIRSPWTCSVVILNCLRKVVATFVHVYLKLWYGCSKTIPAIQDDILKLSAVDVAKKIRNKEVSCIDVLEICINRINSVNPALNFLVGERFDEARKEAKTAEDMILKGSLTKEQLEKDKPFLGVPFTIKDSISVKGLPLTAGLTYRKGIKGNKDAEVVQLLKDSGAIIIAMTNVPELCMWWESHNHLYGRTNNPYNTTRIVGGSSGGEGAIQAAAGSMFGVGSDIGGSIRMPSYFNGIFGHKTSCHIVSNKDQFPETTSDYQLYFLSVGPMVRHAVDMKPLLKIMAGKNSEKLKLDEPVDVSKLKYFYQYDGYFPLADSVDPEITAALRKVVEYLNESLKIRAEEKKITLLSHALEIWLTLMKTEDPVVKYLTGKDGDSVITKELLKSIVRCSDNTLVGLLTSIESKKSEKEFNYQGKMRDLLEKEFKDMLGDNGVFLFPVHPTAAPYHNEPIVRPMNFAYTAAINLLGLPSTSVPLGLNSEKLPIGIQVIANHNNDRLCLAVAEELEKAFGGWVEPQKRE